MVQPGSMLVGVRGIVAGERFPLEPGSELIVGRSPACEVCLSKCRGWVRLSEQERLADDDFNSVSRRHLRLAYHATGTIELHDMSSNGTFVDGQPVQRLLIRDLTAREYEIRLGRRETFRLLWSVPPE